MLHSDEVPGSDAEPPPWGPSREHARLIGRGERLLDVLPALHRAPYGDEDVAVVFDHLDFTNRAIRDHFSFEDPRTMLVCFALARPQSRPLSTNDRGPAGGPMHAVRTCIVHTFKLAMEDGVVPPIGSIATRYFGPALVSGETWG
ncbi:hypothetical protein [Streptomyces sp. NPDC056682]|uniref:hypothetical protein n=1 Tax=Streptomyces sp. NPDC056682 TaxID=3345909 RepID=UPI0036948CB7